MALTSKRFWIDAAERALSTMAQVAITLLTVDGTNQLAITSTGFWYAVGLAGLLSILKALVASGLGDNDSASLAPEVRS